MKNFKNRLQNLTRWANFVATHHRKNELFLDFAAPKFGSYRKNSYLCSVKMYVLTTPLSAGSKP